MYFLMHLGLLQMTSIPSGFGLSLRKGRGASKTENHIIHRQKNLHSAGGMGLGSRVAMTSDIGRDATRLKYIGAIQSAAIFVWRRCHGADFRARRRTNATTKPSTEGNPSLLF